MSNFEVNSLIISQICQNIEPGKKMLQKLMYLIDRNGIDLNLNYSIHFFGPYSSKLDKTMHILESYDKLFIDTSGSTHIIHLGESPIEGSLDEYTQLKVDEVINNFIYKSAYELEAITTTDYVANSMLKNSGTDEEIINKVKQIKGSKFPDILLKSCLALLKQHNFIH